MFWLYVQESRSALGSFLLSAFALPAGLLLFTTGVSEGKPSLRLLAGSMVFALSLLSVMGLGYTLLEDRFRGRLKLIATAPIAASAYMAGVFLFAMCQGLLSAFLMLLLAPVLHLSPHITLVLFPIAVLTTIPMSAIALVTARYAHSIRQGSLLNDMIGTGIVMICPVYYPIELFPAPLRYISAVLPPTYAGDAFLKAMSGGSPWLDLAVLGTMSCIAMLLWSRLVPWRSE
jgi:ABC-2 type transport system permease protein